MSVLSMITDAVLGAAGQVQSAAGQAAAAQPLAQPVDVEAVLTERQRAKGGAQLNWRTSIADLMRLLDLDPSLDNRKELATELGYTGAKDGSAEMNIWLHRQVMGKPPRMAAASPRARRLTLGPEGRRRARRPSSLDAWPG